MPLLDSGGLHIAVWLPEPRGKNNIKHLRVWEPDSGPQEGAWPWGGGAGMERVSHPQPAHLRCLAHATRGTGGDLKGLGLWPWLRALGPFKSPAPLLPVAWGRGVCAKGAMTLKRCHGSALMLAAYGLGSVTTFYRYAVAAHFHPCQSPSFHQQLEKS